MICPVGSGGTISGIGTYMKEKNPNIKVIGVEPTGSTIFGGEEGCYLSVGAGLKGPSELIMRYGKHIDIGYKVDDNESIEQCRKLKVNENLCLGVTTGMCLAVAEKLENLCSGKNIIVISPDGGENYKDILNF